MKKPDAELTRWKQFGAFAQAFGVDGQAFFKRLRLFEATALKHRVLLASCRRERDRSLSHRRLRVAP
jgi:hypothetical protein